jgi:hypothetical protein
MDGSARAASEIQQRKVNARDLRDLGMDVAGWLARWTNGSVVPFIRGLERLGEIRTNRHNGQNANGGKIRKD